MVIWNSSQEYRLPAISVERGTPVLACPEGLRRECEHTSTTFIARQMRPGSWLTETDRSGQHRPLDFLITSSNGTRGKHKLCGTPGCELPDWHRGLCSSDRLALEVSLGKRRRVASVRHGAPRPAADDAATSSPHHTIPSATSTKIRIGECYQATRLPEPCEDFFDQCVDGDRGDVLVSSAELEQTLQGWHGPCNSPVPSLQIDEVTSDTRHGLALLNGERFVPALAMSCTANRGDLLGELSTTRVAHHLQRVPAHHA